MGGYLLLSFSKSCTLAVVLFCSCGVRFGARLYSRTFGTFCVFKGSFGAFPEAMLVSSIVAYHETITICRLEQENMKYIEMPAVS
jgi:hypothetical protein